MKRSVATWSCWAAEAFEIAETRPSIDNDGVLARDELIVEIEGMSDADIAAVLDHARRLKLERNPVEPVETAILSESALAKDWLDPTEDAAWRDL